MVERLKEAIEKARQRRDSRTPEPAGVAIAAPAAMPAVIDALATLDLDPVHLRRHRVVSLAKTDPAHIPFDVLRTRLLKVCADQSWKWVGITSPTKGCGKTTIGVNLAYSIARQANKRVLLLDLDLRNPSVAGVLGVPDAPAMAEFLSGAIPGEQFFRRIEANLIVGLGRGAVRDSAELLQGPAAAQHLRDALAMIQPDIVLCDLPPVLTGDDMIGFLPNLDAVMMVIAADLTRPQELEEAERMVGNATNFLGVLLNRCGEAEQTYAYAYD